MEAHDVEFGPVDILVIGFPAGAPMTGDSIPLLLDLVDRGIIRVLDVLFVMENEDGTFTGFEAQDLESDRMANLVDWCPSRSRPETAPSSARYRSAAIATCASCSCRRHGSFL